MSPRPSILKLLGCGADSLHVAHDPPTRGPQPLRIERGGVLKVVIAIAIPAFALALAATGAGGSNRQAENGRILYTHQAFGNDADGGLVAVNANGTGDVLIAFPASNGVWSPDGKRVLYESRKTGKVQLWTANDDASHPRQLVVSPGNDGDPAWSPDGIRIAFESDRANPGGSDVYTANAAATRATRLTVNGGFNGDPAWSPDGTKIAFTSDRAGTKDIWVMNADGSGVTQLTNTPALDENPAWSPDGTHIAFDTDRPGSENLDVWVMKADGSSPHALTPSPALDALPAWSPDGTQIAFVSERSGKHERFIYRMNADGSNVKLVVGNPNGPGGPLMQSEPAWGVRSAGDTCTLEGTVNDDSIDGTPRSDVICGLGGDDFVQGWGGNDLVTLPEGRFVDGGPGNDTLRSCGWINGNYGDDKLYALRVPGCLTEVIGDYGNDVIYARNGQRDIIDGGPGRDIAYLDRFDKVTNVEIKRYRSTP